MDSYSIVELVNSIPTIVAQQALNKLETDLNLIPFVNKEFTNDIASYGRTVQIEKYGNLVANTKVGKTPVTLQDPAGAKVDVVLSQYKEVSFLIEDIAGAMSKPDAIQNRLGDAMLTIMEDAEAYLYGVGATLTGTNGAAKVYTPANILTDIRASSSTLTAARAPRSDRGVFLANDMYSQLIANENIALAQNYGANTAVVEGRVPRVAGFSVYETIFANSAADVVSSLALHKDALTMVARALPAVGAQNTISQAIVTRDGMIPMRVTVSYDPNALGTQVTVDALYGAAVLRDELGVKLLEDVA